MTKTVAPKRILVVKNRAMGDALLGLSALQYLRELFPVSQISYATPDWMSDLFRDENPLIDTAIPLKFQTVADWWRSFKQLKKYNFDVILELNRAGRSGTFFELFSKLSGVPYYYHNHNLEKGHFVVDQGKRKPNIQRDLDLIYSYATKVLGLNLTMPQYLNYEPSFPSAKSPSVGQKFLVAGVVATRETKMWPAGYWQSFFKLFHQNYPDYKVLMPLSKSELDQNKKKEIFPEGVPAFVECLEVPLSEVKKVIKAGSLYLGNDTGLKHLCIALGMNSVSFFGPEEPLEWHPYARSRHDYFFVEPLECRTLTSHFCALDHCSVMACMRPFTPEKVMEKISTFLPK